jgi:hypothetical protein
MKELSIVSRKREVAPGAQIDQEPVPRWQNRQSMTSKDRRSDVRQEERPIRNDNDLEYRSTRGQSTTERRQTETEKIDRSRRDDRVGEQIKGHNTYL